VNQTLATGHGTGEVRDQLNALIQGDVGTNIDAYSNIKSAVDATSDGEANQWKLRTFSAVLTADCDNGGYHGYNGSGSTARRIHPPRTRYCQRLDIDKCSSHQGPR